MDEPTPEWQVPSCDPCQWGHLRMGTGHLLAAPSAPTSHMGERWWLGGRHQGRGRELAWGTEDTTAWESPGRAGPSPHHLLLPAVSKGQGQSWGGGA